jgi:hypothetical protein
MVEIVKKKKYTKILVGNPYRKGPIFRPGYRYTKNVVMERCSQIVGTTGNTPGQNLTVGQYCFEEDIAER